VVVNYGGEAIYTKGLIVVFAKEDDIRYEIYLFALNLMSTNFDQTWESGAFERTRGGGRAVTRPLRINSDGYPDGKRFPVFNRLF